MQARQRLLNFPITMVESASNGDRQHQRCGWCGSWWTAALSTAMISTASAAELKLKTSPAPFGFYLMGVHERRTSRSRGRRRSLWRAFPCTTSNSCGRSEVGQGSIGLLGSKFPSLRGRRIRSWSRVVRLMKAEDCRKAFLAYWVGKSCLLVIDLVPAPALSSGPRARHTALARARLRVRQWHRNSRVVRYGRRTIHIVA